MIAVVAALLLGGAALMGTLAFAGQMFFEYQKLTSRPPDGLRRPLKARTLTAGRDGSAAARPPCGKPA